MRRRRRAALAFMLALPYATAAGIWAGQRARPAPAPGGETNTSARVLGVALVHSLDGVVEPCGCGGERAGGLAAVVDAVAGLRARAGDPLLVVDGGDSMTPTPGPWHAMVGPAVAQAHATLRPAVVCVGEQDLPHLGPLAAAGALLACGNLLGTGAEPVAPWRAVGGRVLITSLVDPAIAPPGRAAPLRDAWGRFVHAVADRQGVGIAFLHVGPQGRRLLLHLAAREPTPVVLVDCHDPPALVPGATACGTSVVVRTRRGGREVAVLEFAMPTTRTRGLRALDHPTAPTTDADPGLAAVVPVGFRLAVHAAAAGDTGAGRALLDWYDHALRARVAPDRAPVYGGYAGAPACVSCHPGESARWRETPHAAAMVTLRALGRAGRADCTACHVTGDLLATPNGWLPPRAPDHLEGVQCESCHGPGASHAAAPRVARMAMPSAATCLVCHGGKLAAVFDYEAMTPMATCQPSDAPLRRALPGVRPAVLRSGR